MFFDVFPPLFRNPDPTQKQKKKQKKTKHKQQIKKKTKNKKQKTKNKKQKTKNKKQKTKNKKQKTKTKTNKKMNHQQRTLTFNQSTFRFFLFSLILSSFIFKELFDRSLLFRSPTSLSPSPPPSSSPNKLLSHTILSLFLSLISSLFFEKFCSLQVLTNKTTINHIEHILLPLLHLVSRHPLSFPLFHPPKYQSEDLYYITKYISTDLPFSFSPSPPLHQQLQKAAQKLKHIRNIIAHQNQEDDLHDQDVQTMFEEAKILVERVKGRRRREGERERGWWGWWGGGVEERVLGELVGLEKQWRGERKLK